MQRNSQLSWRNLFGAIGAYLFFALQFLVPTNSMIKLVNELINPIGFYINSGKDSTVAIAIFLFFPYIFLFILFNFYFNNISNRISIRERIPRFEDAIDNIVRYHEQRPIRDILDKILDRRSDTKRHADCHRIIKIMIDVLITDLRDAFQQLLIRDEVKVAIIVENEEDGQKLLYILSTTQFNYKHENSAEFVRSNHGYPGFCGDTWDKKMSVSGTYRAFLIMKDNRYSQWGPEDKQKSFICFPIMSKVGRFSDIIAVLSVDSAYRYDLLMSRDLREIIDSKVRPLNNIIVDYLECLRYSSA